MKYFNPEKLFEAKVTAGGKTKEMSSASIDRLKGKSEDANGSGGLFSVDAPTEEDLVPIESLPSSKNKRRLYSKLEAEEPFFIQGRAGWAKTSLIKQMAKKFGRTIITVYLDKAERTDLGGTPVPVESEIRGQKAKLEYAFPVWAQYMLEHPETNFLLFFDEMNQAAPDILNALMPIVLENEICNRKFNNFMVGAAGNLQSENDLQELPAPLRSRFGTPIIWETNTESTWSDAFAYLRTAKPKLNSHYTGDKTWSDILGSEIIDELEKSAMFFKNPRELERILLNQVYVKSKSKFHADWTPEEILEILESIAEDNASYSRYSEKQKADQLSKLAEVITNFIHSGGKPQEAGEEETKKARKAKGGRRAANAVAFDQDTIDSIARALKKGFTLGSDGETKYGISKESVLDTVATTEDEKLTAEQKEQLMRKINAYMEKNKLVTKFETDKEFLDKGYVKYEEGDE